MLCVFGERERQRERTCREAGRGKEGERETGGREGGAEGGRETEPLRRTGVLEPSQLRFQPLREHSAHLGASFQVPMEALLLYEAATSQGPVFCLQT